MPVKVCGVRARAIPRAPVTTLAATEIAAAAEASGATVSAGSRGPVTGLLHFAYWPITVNAKKCLCSTRYFEIIRTHLPEWE